MQGLLCCVNMQHKSMTECCLASAEAYAVVDDMLIVSLSTDLPHNDSLLRCSKEQPITTKPMALPLLAQLTVDS